MSLVNVLVIDGEKTNGQVACSFLKTWGVQSIVANCSAEAALLVASRGFHFVLVDMDMPHAEGAVASRQIRAINRTIPIIGLSALRGAEDQGKALEPAVDDYLAKPLALRDFRSKLEKFVPDFPRSLFINFETYTDGDPHHKAEFISLLIENLEELQCALRTAGEKEGNGILLRVFHKVKASMDMLRDVELIRTIADVRAKAIIADQYEALGEKMAYLNDLCQRVKESLRASLDPWINLTA